MKSLSDAFELRNLLRNVYFWLAAGAAILLLYVGFIAFTFLPRSTSEVTDEKKEVSTATANDENASAENPKKDKSSRKTGVFSKARFEIVKNGGWVDSDDGKMTIVVSSENLDSDINGDIVRSGSFEIEIDGEKATIINSEPFHRNRILTRAEAALSSEKFEKFKNGASQEIEIKVTVRYDDDFATDFISERFRKGNKTEVEGVKIVWK